MKPCRTRALLCATLLAAACTTTGEPSRESLDPGEWRSAKAALYRRLAGQYLRAGDRREARQLLEQSLEFAPRDRDALELLTRLAYADADLDAARTIASHLLEVAPGSVTALCTLGAIAEAQRDDAAAEQAYRRAAAAAGDPEPLLDLHRFYVARERAADAERVRAELAERFPGRIEALLDEGSHHAHHGRWPAAAAAYRQALDVEPASVDAAARLAIAGLCGSTPELVLEVGRRLAPRSRLGSRALTVAMVIARAGSHDFDGALRELELLDADALAAPRLRVLRGELLRRAGRIAEARAELEAAAAADPSLARAHSALARLHLQEGRRHAAIRALEAAVRGSPAAAADHVLLAACLAADDPDTARRHLAIATGQGGAEALVAEVVERFPQLAGAAGARSGR